MWLAKFVFFKGRRENKGPLPVCFHDQHALLGATQDFNVFSSGLSDALFKLGRSGSAPYLQPHLSPLLFCGLTGENSCVFSICFSLPPSYGYASMILELKNGEQNVGLSSGEFLVVSKGDTTKLFILWIPHLDRLLGLPLSSWISPIIQLP